MRWHNQWIFYNYIKASEHTFRGFFVRNAEKKNADNTDDADLHG